MIGVYDYTVILTYLSAASGLVGIYFSLSVRQPYWACIMLLICGLCDTFDGMVARTKKNRTNYQKQFGVQIDSLSDLIAFGVLPPCIGICMYMNDKLLPNKSVLLRVPFPIVLTVSIVFVLCALIRLANFNVLCEEMIGEKAKEKVYIGLPVTVTALIFPTFMVIKYCIGRYSLSYIYYILLIIVGFLFISKIKIKKANFTQILIMVGIGAIEFIVVVLFRYGIIKF